MPRFCPDRSFDCDCGNCLHNRELTKFQTSFSPFARPYNPWETGYTPRQIMPGSFTPAEDDRTNDYAVGRKLFWVQPTKNEKNWMAWAEANETNMRKRLEDYEKKKKEAAEEEEEKMKKEEEDKEREEKITQEAKKLVVKAFDEMLKSRKEAMEKKRRREAAKRAYLVNYRRLDDYHDDSYRDYFM